MIKKRILIVEDEDTAQPLIRLLARKSYFVEWALDAVMAMTFAIRNLPDLVVLDMGLPAGGGETVLEQIRRNPSMCCIPVLVLTGDRTVDREKLLGMGADGVFIKSDDINIVLAEIDRKLQSNGEAAIQSGFFRFQQPAGT